MLGAKTQIISNKMKKPRGQSEQPKVINRHQTTEWTVGDNVDEPQDEPSVVEGGDSEHGRSPPWRFVTVEDLTNFALEQPIADSDAADCNELAVLYRAQAFPDEKVQPPDSPKLRVFTLISAALNMYFKPEERNEPFGAFVTWADGRRSQIPSDLVPHIDVLAHIAQRVTNPVLKARLADICWILDRKRWQLGHAALSAYVNTVTSVDLGILKFQFSEVDGALRRETCNHLRRALFIGRTVGWDRPETQAARQLVEQLRLRSAADGQLMSLLWFSELDLQFGITKDTAELASAMETAIATQPVPENSHDIVDLWNFSSRAYFRAKRESDAYRCRSEAAENLVRQAEAVVTSSPLMASTLLSSAIAQLGGSPFHKTRRQELRHRLIDVQPRVLDEMSSFSHPMDLSELVEDTRDRLGKVGLLQKLFLFACLARSPEPEDLHKEASQALRANPLSGLFGATHLDRDGKVLHRTMAGSIGSDADSAILAQIMQAEKIRRHVLATGAIDVARQMIITGHYVSPDGLNSLLQLSPAVPPALAWTISHGFLRFLQGDFTGSTYILIPMLEAILRHLLRCAGHDVTTFDDANQTQEDRTISSMFDSMRAELDEILGTALTMDLENVFLKKPGPSLRHALAHGLLHDGSPFATDAIYGCWLILRLCLLPLVPHRHDLEAPADWLAHP